MLQTAGITMQFGAKPLFENVSVKFGEGHRYGLIGANGCGKSTFMRILAGDLEMTHGQVVKDKHVRLARLRQDQFAYEDSNVLDVVIMGHDELWQLKQERDRIYGMAEMSDADAEKIGDLEMRFGELDGYTAESRAGELLLGVGIPIERHSGPMSEIAPGFKLRVLLTQALFADPDVLLLDEPTNNLDINTIRWLESVLDAKQSTMVIISHDRHFLNSICTHMADLDYGAIQLFPGSYDEYMEAATMARAQQQSANTKAKDKISELQDFVRRFSANKSKARQATSRQKMIEKIKIEDIKPSSRQYPFIRFDFDEKGKLHRQAVSLEKMSKTYPGLAQPLFKNFNLMIDAGEKLAIIGANGLGKTTLVRCIVSAFEAENQPPIDTLTPDFGTIKWAEKANVGYLAQNHDHEFDNGLNVYDWMNRFRQPGDDEQIIRGTLGRLLFSADDIVKPVKVLSGGEKMRMMFGKLMLSRHNVLVLDEPTNHLDMESIESLNEALERFKGTLIFVSHDRASVGSLADRVLELTPEGVQDFRGGYDDYLVSRGME